jgi:hypothetical protein
MVEEDLSIAEAAKRGGLSESAVYKARQHAVVQQYYRQKVRELVGFTKHKAVHALRKEMEGPNAASRVSAARALWLEGDDSPRMDHRVPGSPGLVVIIGQPTERPPVNPPREPVTISTPRTISSAAPAEVVSRDTTYREREPEPVDQPEWWRGPDPGPSRRDAARRQ